MSNSTLNKLTYCEDISSSNVTITAGSTWAVFTNDSTTGDIYIKFYNQSGTSVFKTWTLKPGETLTMPRVDNVRSQIVVDGTTNSCTGRAIWEY